MAETAKTCPKCGSMLAYEDQWVRNWTCGTLSRHTEAGDNVVESVACLRIALSKCQAELEYVRAIIKICDKYDSEFSWMINEAGQIEAAINCNDCFWWATADAEPILRGDIELLRKTFEDCEAAVPRTGIIYADMLFASRKRNMRPQGAAYPKKYVDTDKTDYSPLWKLFDAAGPQRDIDKSGFGNPKAAPTDAELAK